jgi:hypothetical protein
VRILFLLLAFSQLALAVQPKISAEPARIDFGTVEEGAVVEREFQISNRGDAKLEISRIVAPCGCTVPEMDKRTLAPGESAPLKVRFETRGFFGRKVRSVRIYTNEGENHSVVLELVGEVRRAVSVSPPRLNFDDLLQGSTSEQSFTVAVNNPQLKLGLVSTRSRFIAVESEGDESRKTVVVKILPSAPPGILRASINVTVEGGATVAVPIFARVVSELQFSPDQLSFGLVKSGSSPISRRIQFRNVGQNPVRIDSVSSDKPELTVRTRELSAGRRYELEVALSPFNEGPLRAQISVATDRGVATLPVSAVIATQGE